MSVRDEDIGAKRDAALAASLDAEAQRRELAGRPLSEEAQAERFKIGQSQFLNREAMSGLAFISGDAFSRPEDFDETASAKRQVTGPMGAAVANRAVGAAEEAGFDMEMDTRQDPTPADEATLKAMRENATDNFLSSKKHIAEGGMWQGRSTRVPPAMVSPASPYGDGDTIYGWVYKPDHEYPAPSRQARTVGDLPGTLSSRYAPIGTGVQDDEHFLLDADRDNRMMGGTHQAYPEASVPKKNAGSFGMPATATPVKAYKEAVNLARSGDYKGAMDALPSLTELRRAIAHQAITKNLVKNPTALISAVAGHMDFPAAFAEGSALSAVIGVPYQAMSDIAAAQDIDVNMRDLSFRYVKGPIPGGMLTDEAKSRLRSDEFILDDLVQDGVLSAAAYNEIVGADPDLGE